MIESRRGLDETIFLRKMRSSRIRHLTLATGSVVAAAFVICAVNPSDIGEFAFYSIVFLLLVNALLAVIQCARVIVPVGKILRRIQMINRGLDNGDFSGISHIGYHTEDGFGCLAAGIDCVFDKLVEQLRINSNELKFCQDVISAHPVGMVAVSRTGKICRIIKNPDDSDGFYGVKVGELPDASVWGWVNMKIYSEALLRTFETNRVEWLELHIVRPGQHSSRHYRCSLKPMNGIFALFTAFDITDLDRNFSAKIIANINDRHEERRLALRHMAASIAHDGKNIFAALGNLVALHRNSSDPFIREQIPIAEDAITRGCRLMNELVSYSGEMKFTLKSYPAKEALEKVLGMPALAAIRPDNVSIFVEVSNSPMPNIDLDMEQAWKVPFNLVKNAIEAMGEAGGRIWIRSEPYEMTESIARKFRFTGNLPIGHGILTAITDDGPGIPPDILERIFDPYFSSKGTGRGLGLATVMTIIDAHGGAIRAESQLGHGTTFYIYNAASRNSDEELAMIREVAPNGEVLLVDDDPAILKTTSLVLRSLKIAAHPASTRDDAIRKLRSLRERIRAVIMDAHLGGEVSDRLLQSIHTEFPAMPVIVSSGSNEENIRELFNGVPYDRYLEKPYSISDFEAALKAVMK